MHWRLIILDDRFGMIQHSQLHGKFLYTTWRKLGFLKLLYDYRKQEKFFYCSGSLSTFFGSQNFCDKLIWPTWWCSTKFVCFFLFFLSYNDVLGQSSIIIKNNSYCISFSRSTIYLYNRLLEHNFTPNATRYFSQF